MVLSCVLPRPAFLLPIRLSPDTTDLIKPNSEFYEALVFDFFSIIIGGISRARPPISATLPNSHTTAGTIDAMPTATRKSIANSGKLKAGKASLTQLVRIFARKSVTASAATCSAIDSNEYGLVVAHPTLGRWPGREMMPVRMSSGSLSKAGSSLVCLFFEPQRAKITPPTIAESTATAASFMPAESSAPPTAAATPKPLTKPTDSMMPN